jgi:hypothetical protein
VVAYSPGAFNAIKRLVISRHCLTTINHDSPGKNKLFLTCNASNSGTGAILSWGPSWKDSRPVAFDSQHYSGAQHHYPTHKQELLAIIRALHKWHSDILGVHVEIYTDHRMLLNFDTQKDLSQRQARWMEFLSQYDYTFHYVPGTLNSAADALSHLPITETTSRPDRMMVATTFLADLPLPVTQNVHDALPVHPITCASLLRLDLSNTVLHDIQNGYLADSLAIKVRNCLSKGSSIPGFEECDGLIFYNERILVPKVAALREQLFFLAHNQLGHFGADKSYLNLRKSFYWPNMRVNLEKGYIAGCEACQMNKAPTTRPAGPLHPLPVPDRRFSSVAIDFVGPLSITNG